MANDLQTHRISRRAVLWLVSVAVAFLLGFVPQFFKARSARQDAATVRQELEAARHQTELARARDLIALVQLEVAQKNYGVAAQRSTGFFDHLQGLAARETDSTRRGVLQQALASRDAVTAGLAAADPAVGVEVQRLLRMLQEVR